jgi:hypothetical protein
MGFNFNVINSFIPVSANRARFNANCFLADGARKRKGSKVLCGWKRGTAKGEVDTVFDLCYFTNI